MASHVLFTLACIFALRMLAFFFFLIVVAQMVKNLPETQETWIQFRGWEDPLKKEIIIHSSILAWRIPGTEDPDWLQSMGSHTWLSDQHWHFLLLPKDCRCCLLFSVANCNCYKSLDRLVLWGAPRRGCNHKGPFLLSCLSSSQCYFLYNFLLHSHFLLL